MGEPTTQTVSYQLDSSLDGYTGGFFPRAKDFNVSGGTFTSVSHIYQAAPSVPTDFRLIPLGDLNLLHKIDHGVGVVQRRQRVPPVMRRFYTAQIPGLQRATAAVYEGDGAEEQWREEIARYSNLRHPNLVQLYGVVKTQDLHVAVFHDDLVPHAELKNRYYSSHLSFVYFYATLDEAFSDVNAYVTPFLCRGLSWFEYTVWIRPATGHPCIELATPKANSAWVFGAGPRSKLSGKSLLQPPTDPEILGAISLEDYHDICCSHLSQRLHFRTTNLPVKIGSIRHFPSAEYADSFEIACAPDCLSHNSGWCAGDLIIGDDWEWLDGDAEGTLMIGDGWIRANSSNVAEVYRCHVWVGVNGHASPYGYGWLPQANNIFHRLNITRDRKNYVYIDAVDHWLTFSASVEKLPAGYLFLCSHTDFESEHPRTFRVPECPAYWSLDPSGAERLTADQAQTLGFPDIEFRREVRERYWDDTVYVGIRHFHEAKGLDPFSLDAVIALGCPLTEITCDRDALLAHLVQGSVEVDESSEPNVKEYPDIAKGADDPDSRTGPIDAHSSPLRDCEATNIYDLDDVSEGENISDSCRFEVEMPAPSRSWNIIMSVQFALFLILGLFSFHECFCT
ncbi:hypothetical protein DFH06DRAFT_1213266 [Mycena polygramma]|nr:hypothetical protein DFH06DRAFT_1213266 [Mycena polygramma]